MPLVNPGSPAPAFTKKDQSGKTRSLREFAGRPVVLYFYPKDDTSGCTAEACAFRDMAPDFKGVNAAVVGVSPDNEASHRAFAEKFGLNFPLLADDPDADGTPTVCEAYGVWAEKSMYGRKYMGVVRTTYLIDERGVVARRWDAVKVPGHAEEVIAALDAMGRGASGAAALPAADVEPKPAKARPRAKKTGVKKAPAKKTPTKKTATKTTAASTQKKSSKKSPAKKTAGTSVKAPPAAKPGRKAAARGTRARRGVVGTAGSRSRG